MRISRGPFRIKYTSRNKQKWICNSCRSRNQSRATFSSSTRSFEKPYYITSPIFYVNAAPHVGHLYTMVLTDILKRWQVLQGKKAILCTGTDEHGMKIERAALKAGKPPKEFCDITSETFKTLANRAGISNDHFVRTTDLDHKEAVQYFWTILQERGFIYESKHEGWYCVSDETYYPESTIEKRLDPFTGRTFLASKETGKEVEWTSERNYHFRLSAFKEKLLEFYKENPEFVVPAARMADVVNMVSSGLEDLSISRPVERLSWGVQVPDDPSQTIYVWLDALVNYITKAGYPWAPGQESVDGWPADVQVIGKDIVRFHCIYWPAFLFAVGIKAPKQILTHAHWTLGRQKMAKSTGNVVNPFFALDRFGVDVMRWYLAHDGGILNDADYGNNYIVERYKKGLQGGLGNLVSRITRPKKWNVKVAVQLAKDVPITTMPENLETSAIDTSALKCTGDKYAGKQVMMLLGLQDRVQQKMNELNPGAALHTIMDAVYQTNQYLALTEPWALANRRDSSTGDASLLCARELNSIVFNCAEAIRIVGILLQPFMPGKAAQLLDMMGVDQKRRTGSFAQYGKDLGYGTPKVEVGTCAHDALFPPLPVET